jgi:hypothetical protein
MIVCINTLSALVFPVDMMTLGAVNNLREDDILLFLCFGSSRGTGAR